MPEDFRYVPLPDGSVAKVPVGMPDEEVYRRAGVSSQGDAGGADTSTFGAFKRGAIRGLAPAAVGLAAAAPGAEVGAAAGSFFGPIGAGIGGLIGGAVTGIPAAMGAGYLQDQAFQAAPGVASALGQSPEQMQADVSQHPYASIAGEVAPNLFAFRPSTLPFRSVGRAASEEAAGAIRSARVNAGVNAAVFGAQAAGSEYSQTGEIDPYAVALQAGIGALGNKATFIGRGLGRTAGILPDAVRARAGHYMGRPVSDTAPTNLLDPNRYDPRETWTGPQQRPAAEPAFSDPTLNRLGIPEVQPESIDPDFERQLKSVRDARAAREGNTKLDRMGVETVPNAQERDMFGYPADLNEQINALRTKPEGVSPTDAAPARDPGQLDMFEENPVSTLRSDYSQRNLLQRMAPDGNPDTDTIKLAGQVSELLKQGRGIEARKLVDDLQADLETSPKYDGETLQRRIAAVEGAQQALADYGRQSTNAYALEAIGADRPGVEVTNLDAGNVVAQRIEAQRQAQEQAMQAQAAAEQQAAAVSDIRQQALQDILEHGNPKSVVPEFIKFLASGKGQHGEVALRENERAMLDQARQTRRRREDMKLALQEQEKAQAAKQSKDEAGQARRQQMEQRIQEQKTQRETERALAKTKTKREEVPPAPEPEPQPTLADLMERAKPAETKSGTVLDKGEGPTPTVKAQKAAKPETVSEKIKQKVAAKRAERKPAAKLKEETPTQKPTVRNRLYSEKLGGPEFKPGDDLPKYAYRNISSEQEIDAIAKDGKLLARGGRDAKYFTMSDRETPSEGNRGSKPVIRVKSENVKFDEPVRAEDVEVWDNKSEKWEPFEDYYARKNAEPDEVTYESVLKEAESYLAADGESGLLKPKEYQQLSVLAEREAFTPKELKQKLDDAVERRRTKDAEAAVESAGRKPVASAIKRVRDEPKPRDEAAHQSTVARLTKSAHAMLRSLEGLGGETGTAARLMRDISPDIEVELLPHDEVQRRVPSKYGETQAYYDPITDKIYVSKWNETPDVIIHEMAHAMTYHQIFDKSLIGRQLDRLFADFKKVQGLSKSYGFTNTHEFVAEIWRSPEFRDELRQRYVGDGHLVDRADGLVSEPTTMLGRFIQIVRDMFTKLLGSKTRQGSAEEASDKILKVLSLTADSAPDRLRDYGTLKDAAPAPFTKKQAEETIQKLPEPVRDTAFKVWDTIHNWAAKGQVAAMFTEDLIQSVQKYIPTSAKYLRQMQDKVVTQRKLENAVNDLGDMHLRLKDKERGMGDGTVNGVIQKINDAGAWAFEPEWLTDKGVEVTIDPELKAEFDKLSPEGQSVVKGVFEQNHKMLMEQRQTAIDNVNGVYDRMIDEAEKAGDRGRVSELTQEKTKELREFRRLFSMDETKPYASTRRYGNYVVVGKSPEMLDAIKQGDTKLINSLKTDEAHYFVNMYETMWEAKAEARRLAAEGFFPEDHVEAYEKDRVRDELVGGKEMMLAFQRLREYIQSQTPGVDVNPKVLAGIERLASDLYIQSLRSTSSRKSELRRLGVAGGDMDMMRNFITQSRATAHLIGAMKHNGDILNSITDMRREASGESQTNKEAAMRAYNEIMLRHLAGMSYRPNAFVDNVKSATSTYFLTTSPAYYLQNALQFAALTAPRIAGKHGYPGVLDTSRQAYAEIGRIWGKSLTDALDIDRIADPNVRRAVTEIADRGGIDIGIDSEMGKFHSLSKGPISRTWAKTDAFLRNLTRKGESINRVVSVMTAYKLEAQALAKRGDMTPEQIHRKAVDYAYMINHETNGSYDGFNAPRFMRSPVGGMLTQFKKFQLMQLTLLGKMVNESMRGMTPEERAVGRRSLMYTMGHTGILAGAMGLPGMAAAEWFLNTFVLGDENEPGDAEKSIREAIGDEAIANLILQGAPTVGTYGINLSNRVGMGQTFSLLPFTDIKPSQEGYNAVVTSLLGPAIGGMGQRMADGTDKMLQGNYWKGLERFLPSGLAAVSAAARESQRGVTKNNNDMLIDPDDISFAQTFARAAGVQTMETSRRYRVSNEQYALKEFYDRRAQEINRAFAAARRDGDAAGMADARQEFSDLQRARVKNGFARQPFSTLIRYSKDQQRREKATVRGVQYEPKSPGLRAALADEADGE